MIRIVEGAPGSGKSYFGVHYVCSRFAKYDAVYDDFTVDKDVVIITNFEKFRPKHGQLDKLIEKYGGVEGFFTVENFEKLIDYYRCKNIILLIDEAQRYFDSKYYNKEVFYFFQYHRHLGVDIFLFTQSVSTIARHLLPLGEFIITASPRSLSIGNTFRYKYSDTKGRSLYSRVLSKNQIYFKAYESFKTDEAEKPKNVVTRLAAMIAIMIVVVFLGGKGVLAMMKAKYAKPIKANVPVTAPSVAPGAIPVSLPSPGKPALNSPVPGPSVSPSSVSRSSRIKSSFLPKQDFNVLPFPPFPKQVSGSDVKISDKPLHEISSFGMFERDGKRSWWVRYSDSNRMIELKPGCQVDEDSNRVVCAN